MQMTSLILRHSGILNGFDTTELIVVYLNNVKERNLIEMTKSGAIVGKNLLISF